MGIMLKYIKITLHSLQEASPQILFFCTGRNGIFVTPFQNKQNSI